VASGAASAPVEEPHRPRDPRWDRSALDPLLAALLTTEAAAKLLTITRVPMTPVSVAISALHPRVCRV
jgi:hypothetical protein